MNEAIRKLNERVKFAELIGAEAGEFALLSSIAVSLPYKQAKNKIVFTNMNFPTVGHVWFAQEPFKDNISIIRFYNAEITLEQYEKEITANTLFPM